MILIGCRIKKDFFVVKKDFFVVKKDFFVVKKDLIAMSFLCINKKREVICCREKRMI